MLFIHSFSNCKKGTLYLIKFLDSFRDYWLFAYRVTIQGVTAAITGLKSL